MKIFIFIFLIATSYSYASETYKDLTRSIYCPTCQGQVLDESNNEVATSMKKLIQEMLLQGKTPDEIKVFFVQVYGEKILLKPSWENHNLLLWVFPFMVFFFLLFMAKGRMHFFLKDNNVK